MNWIKQNRVPLIISVSDSITANNCIGTTWSKLRKTVLERDNKTCRYCGGQYNKYLHCIHIDGKKNNNELSNLGICCKSCYFVTHINYDYEKKLLLCWSTKPQVGIVRDTVDYIIKYKEMPSVLNIDPNAKKIPLSIVEFSNILYEYKYDMLLEEMKNYKIFFNLNFNMEHVTSKIYDSIYMFDDEEINNNIKDDSTMETHALSKVERDFLNKHFHKPEKNTNMKETIIRSLNNIHETRFVRENTDIKYQMLCQGLFY